MGWGVEGSIPACAGEPGAASSPLRPPRVYPRLCGGTRSRADNLLCPRGLSPPVRGNRGIQTTALALMRSIPACAGEPPAHPD